MQHYPGIKHKQTNSCFSGIFCISPGNVWAVASDKCRGETWAGSIGQAAGGKSRLGRKMGFVGALDRKVNGFMRWQ